MSEDLERHFVIPVLRGARREILIDTSEFAECLESVDPSCTCFVKPASTEEICWLTFASAIYSIPVERNRPMQNIVIQRGHSTPLTSELAIQDRRNSSEHITPPLFNVGVQARKDETSLQDVWNKYDVVAVGGTFDRLHAGHRLLLTVASWTTKGCLWVGVTGSKLLTRKKHANLIASFDQRAEDVRSFVQQTKPDLPELRVQELEDAAGASGTDPGVQALVLTKETMKGGVAVNEQRHKSGLQKLDLVVVDILFQSSSKLSSTALRAADFARNSRN